MEFNLYKNQAELGMKKAIESYKLNISKISIGQANPKILDNIKILSYEKLVPINEIASISIPNPRQLLIKPYDVSNTKDIVTAINSVYFETNAINEGDKIRIIFPEVTKERRQAAVKFITNYVEQAKIAIRLSRQEVNKLIKSNEDFSEDEQRKYLEKIQDLTNKYIGEVNLITTKKEEDLMSI